MGALAGTALWLVGTVLLRIYVSNLANFSRTYGFVGGIIVLLLWLYITALSVLFGGEVADSLSAEATPHDEPQEGRARDTTADLSDAQGSPA